MSSTRRKPSPPPQLTIPPPSTLNAVNIPLGLRNFSNTRVLSEANTRASPAGILASKSSADGNRRPLRSRRNLTRMPRERPPRWNVLCKNTVPYTYDYPPPSSDVTRPELCKRGQSCLYGHHGDIFTDNPSSVGLHFNHKGRAIDQPYPEVMTDTCQSLAGNSSKEFTVTHKEKLAHPTKWGGSWIDKREAWRKQEALAKAQANFEFKRRYLLENGPQLDGQKMERESPNMHRSSVDPQDRKSPAEIFMLTKREEGWDIYASPVLNHAPLGEEPYRVGSPGQESHSPMTSSQEPAEFERGLRKLSLDLQGDSCGSEQQKAESSEETEESETVSTATEFIIPPFTKRRPIDARPLNQYPSKDHDSCSVGSAGFLFDPAAPTFIPGSTAIYHPTPPTQDTASESPNPSKLPSHGNPDGLSVDFIPFSTRSQKSSNGNNQTRSARVNLSHQSSHSGKWTKYRGHDSTVNKERYKWYQPAAPADSTTPLWITPEYYKLGLKEGTAPHPMNTCRGGYQRRRPHPQPSHEPALTSNTFIVQSSPKTDVGSYQTPSSFSLQSQLDHTLHQIFVALSLYPDDENKLRTKGLLDRLLAPDIVRRVDTMGYCIVTESLQTALHRLLFTVEKCELELMEGFRLEMWSVLGWLTGNGGKVGVLEVDNICCRSGDATIKPSQSLHPKPNAYVRLTAGQIVMDGSDRNGRGYNEIVGLTPGEPAILTPGLSPYRKPSPSETAIPTLLLNSTPILRSSSISHPWTESKVEIPQPLPDNPANGYFQPLNISPFHKPFHDSGISAEEQENRMIRFFCSDEMNTYLEDSYDKARHIQTLISLKWRRVRKVFEREWCSGISRVARKGIIARAFSRVSEMQETDWLAPKRNAMYTTISTIGKGNSSSDLLEGQQRAPESCKKAVWERRGLCLEAEPVALSEEGGYLCKLIQKMCIEKVMGYKVQRIGGPVVTDPLQLPVCPNLELCGVNYDIGREREGEKLGGRQDRRHMEHNDEKLDGILLQGAYNNTTAAKREKQQEARWKSSAKKGISLNLSASMTAFDDGKPNEMTEDAYATYLIHQLQLQPKLISNPVLDPVFAKMSPIYVKNPCDSPKSTSQGQHEDRNDDSKVWATLVEMCHLDRMLFLGYVVLEILKVWEEQRVEVAKVGWTFPTAAVQEAQERRLKKIVRQTVKIYRNTSIVTPQPPRISIISTQKSQSPFSWADVLKEGLQKDKVENPKRPSMDTPSRASRSNAQVVTSCPQKISSATPGMATPAMNLPTALLLVQSNFAPSSISSGPKALYTDVVKGNMKPKRPENQPAIVQPAPAEVFPPSTKDIWIDMQRMHALKEEHKAKNGKGKTETRHQWCNSEDYVCPESSTAEAGEEMHSEDDMEENIPYSRELQRRHTEADKIKSGILDILHKSLDDEAGEAGEAGIEQQKHIIRSWLQDLEYWLWIFNEGLGVKFVEADKPTPASAPSETSGLSPPITENVKFPLEGENDGTRDKDAGPKRKAHRGGKRNVSGKETQRGLKEKARLQRIMRRKTIETEMREAGVFFMRGGLKPGGTELDEMFMREEPQWDNWWAKVAV